MATFLSAGTSAVGPERGRQVPGFTAAPDYLRGPRVETFPIARLDARQSVLWTPMPGERGLGNILYTPIPGMGYGAPGNLGILSGPQILYTPIHSGPSMSILMKDGGKSGRSIPGEAKVPAGVELKKPSPHLEVGDHIDVTKFTERVRGKQDYFDPKNGWVLSKEKALNSGSGSHGGGVWKLQYRDRNIACVDNEGKIIRKYK